MKVRRLLRSLLKVLAKKGIISPFAIICKWAIEMVPGEIKSPIILALTPHRYRGDLEILSKEFRVLKIRDRWQSRINSLFLGNGIPFDYHYHPTPEIKEKQDRLLAFLKRLLTVIFRQLKVDCVISAAVHNQIDYYWGWASEEISIPFIVLHRENLLASEEAVKKYLDRWGRMGKFKGSMIIVHNEVSMEVLIKCGYASLDKVKSLGCLRMDDLIKKVKNGNKPANGHSRKKVTLFSFVHNVGIRGCSVAWSNDGKSGFINLFNNVHASIARLAKENPNVDFVIKPKWGGDWPYRIADACLKKGIDIKEIKNLSIIFDCNVHDLILSSDVICGFGSTTLLEAAIAAKPVIVPLFDEASDTEYSDKVLLRDKFYIFDIAHSIDEFENFIMERLNNFRVSPEIMSERFKVFNRYVSSTEGDALGKYGETMKDVIYNKRQI